MTHTQTQGADGAGTKTAGQDRVERVTRAILDQRGFHYAEDPMEFGQNAYDITNEARAEAIVVLNALGEQHATPTQPSGANLETLAVPDGWMLVPEDATGTMWQAGKEADEHPGDSYSAVWRSMVGARPRAPVLLTPAPAATPGVPDSVRKAIAFAAEAEGAPNGRAARRYAGLCCLQWVETLLSPQADKQTEPPALRAVVEVYPDRTDTRLTFGDRIQPEPGVKAVQQAIAALTAEYEARGGCPVVGRHLAGQSAGSGAETDALVDRFSAALKAKLCAAEAKYGWQNGWLQEDWAADCQRDLLRHVRKGDPLDVAAYAAFCWHHGWPTTPNSTPAPATPPGVPDSLRALSEAATQGDWVFERMHDDFVGVYSDDRTGSVIANFAGFHAAPRPKAEQDANARFAAEAVNHVRALISAETTETPYGWTYIWTSDDCDGGAVEQKFSRTKPDATNPYISDIVPLFAAQPAGQAGDAGIEATQITLGEGMVDITRIDHEGRTGVLFRPRKERIPFGEPGELPEGTYWPVKGDVVLWVSGEGPGVAIKALADLAPNSTRTGAAETGCVLVPAKATREWAYAMAIARQGQSSAPRCEPTSEREIEWAADRINEALAARPEAPSDAGWNFDMEAAPQDGTRILLWMHGCWIHPVIGYRAPSAPGSQRDCWREHGSRARIHRADCWRLIPAGPTPPSDPAPSGQAEG